MKTIKSKEPYLKKLDIRGNVYEQFVPDQVLTHNNLNKIVDYFEDQDRLSRIHLSGVGIGCGLNITTHTNNKFEIGQGVGITTDGDLIKTETSEFLYYSIFADKGEYPLFNDLEVFEVHTQEGAGREGEHPLSSLSNLQNYLVIAYVENYTEDAGLCDGFNCDDSGTKVYANLKFLITHKKNFEALIAADTIYNNHNVLAYYDGLPELHIPRLLLNVTNTKSTNNVYNQFRNKTLSNDLLKELNDAYITIINKLRHRINFEKFGVRKSEVNTFFTNLKDDLNTTTEITIQYKYDFVKDLLETYQQIRELLLHIHFECVPTVKAFPKHLLLGTLSEKTRIQTRHQFYPSPIVSGNDEKLMEVRSLIIKFFYQLKQYKIPEIKSAAIKITPSKSYENNLSLRAIPYYYQTRNALVRNWNFKDLQNRKETNQLGYHKNNLKNTPSIQKPLEYIHLDKDFYRIEGHIGKNYKTALHKINKLKSEYNLAFDVKTISIGTPISKVNLNDIKCQNKNYLTLLKTWEKDFICKADSAIAFFNQYSTETVGHNYTSTNAYEKTKTATKALEIADNFKRKTTDASTKEMHRNKSTFSAASSTNQNYQTSLQAVIDTAYSHVQAETYSSFEIVAISESLLGNIINIDINADDRFLYLTNPIKIIADLQVLKRDFLQDLNGFYQTSKWIKFNNALNQLCIDLKQAILRLSNISDSATFGKNDYDKMYDYFIYELSDFCCLKEKMAWLKGELDTIRENLYKDLILSELIQKHPGIEHMAGVPKGGTFLMVYEGGIENQAKSKTPNKARIAESSFRSEVLFDFALPYICASDCPPETIVYQIEVPTTPEPVDLEITPQVFCVPGDTTVPNASFTVTPTGASLTSPQGDSFLEVIGNNYDFNPNNVSNALAGEPITFFVNNEAIPASKVEIIVYKLPLESTITIKEKVWKNEGLVIEFLIDHVLAAKNYFVYTWKKDTGEVLIPIEPANPNKFLFPDVNNAVTAKVVLEITVDNDLVNCKTEIPFAIDETRPVIAVGLDIPKRTYCLPKENALESFSVTPQDGELRCVQNNSVVGGSVARGFVFIPERVPILLLGQPLTFTVNNEVIPASDVELFVYKLPKIISIALNGSLNWMPNQVEVNVTVSHELDALNYFDYTWTYKGQSITPTDTTNLDFKFLLPETGNVIAGEELKLFLGVANQNINCTTNGKLIITGERPPNTTSVNIPKTSFCLPKEGGVGDTVITVIPAGAKLESQQTGNFIVEDGNGGYTFNPNGVGNNLLGEPITFLVNGELPDTSDVVKVYKLPTKVTPTYSKVSFTSKGITINLGTNNPTSLENKNYLEYTWTLITGRIREVISNKKTDNVFISNPSSSINAQLELSVKVSALGTCSSTFTAIPINETRDTTTPPNPTSNLTCDVPLNNRYETLNIRTVLTEVLGIVKNNILYKNTIHSPIMALLTELQPLDIKNLKVPFLRAKLSEVKLLRQTLKSDFIGNRLLASFRNSFLKTDEVLELIVLELLRCITPSQSNFLIESINTFFTASNTMKTFRIEIKIPRELINATYIRDYNANEGTINTKVVNTFAK